MGTRVVKNIVLPAIILAVVGVALVLVSLFAISIFALPSSTGIAAVGVWLVIDVVYLVLAPRKKRNANPLADIVDDRIEASPFVSRVLAVMLSFVLFVAFRSLAFQPGVVAGNSMLPGLHDRQVFVISKFAYGYGRFSFPLGIINFEGRIFGTMPQAGDVIVYRNLMTGGDAISRVIGAENDEFELTKGIVRINGRPAQLEDGTHMNPKIRRETLPNGVGYDVLFNPSLSNGRAYRAPSGAILVMGDNREMAAPTIVSVQDIVGRVELLLR